MDESTRMNKPALDRHALETYLRFSYPVGTTCLCGDDISYPDIRFSLDRALT